MMEKPLLYFALKITGDEQNALDVLQEVWVRAFRDLRKLRDHGALRPWLYRMTRGIAIDRFRRERVRERAEESSREIAAAEPSFSDCDTRGIHQALDQLEPLHREVLTLYFLEDFGIGEIARILDRPEGTVKSRLHYAKHAMKTILMRGGYGKQ